MDSNFMRKGLIYTIIYMEVQKTYKSIVEPKLTVQIIRICMMFFLFLQAWHAHMEITAELWHKMW